MIRQAHLIAVVGAFLIGCAVLILVGGCAGVRSEASKQEKEQGNTEATASEEARCSQTRTYKSYMWEAVFTTNDVPGCPKGGLLSGTDKADYLDGKKGEDEIRSLGGSDIWIFGGSGNDVIYGGPGIDLLVGNGGDDLLYGGDGGDEGVEGGKGEDVIYGGAGSDYPVGGKGEDVFYGGDGSDSIEASGDGERDKLYCGAGGDGLRAAQALDVGYDEYHSDKTDYVDSSCEKKFKPGPIIP